MPDRIERQPAFELDVAAEAKDIRFQVLCGLETHSEGLAPVEHVRQRRRLPSRVREGTRYTNVSASLRIAGWLEDADGGSEP